MAMALFLARHKRKILTAALILALMLAGLCGQLGYLMIFRSEHYSERAKELHERERTIKAARGEIRDRNGTVIAANRTVSTVSVIHSQVSEPEKVIGALCAELGLPQEEVQKKVEKRSSREIIKTNVAKETGDRIRSYGLSGSRWTKTINGIIPLEAWLPRCWGLPEATTRALSVWRCSMTRSCRARREKS